MKNNEQKSRYFPENPVFNMTWILDLQMSLPENSLSDHPLGSEFFRYVYVYVAKYRMYMRNQEIIIIIVVLLMRDVCCNFVIDPWLKESFIGIAGYIIYLATGYLEQYW